MSLEAATYINQLVPSNPTGSDSKGQGDDHLRLIKQALVNTFPSIDKPVNVNSDQINQLNQPGVVCVSGMIMLWISTYPIPAGWILCDGANNTPDLRDRFVVGGGLSYGYHSTGGSNQHTHGITIDGTSLNVDQMPAHIHETGLGTNDTVGTGWTQASPGNSGGANRPSATLLTNQVGSGAPHTHGANVDVRDNRPPYYALAYIMKT